MQFRINEFSKVTHFKSIPTASALGGGIQCMSRTNSSFNPHTEGSTEKMANTNFKIIRCDIFSKILS